MKFDRHSIRFKLFLYFTLLAAAILCLLWLLQTVLLKSLYEGMMTSELERVAVKLAAARNTSDFESRLDRAAYNNSILVYVIRKDGMVIYSTDEHTEVRDKTDLKERAGILRRLPVDYENFLAKLAKSKKGRIAYILRLGESKLKTLVLGVKLDNAVLYISKPLDPLNITMVILRRQLLYVSAAALLMGVGIAFLIARRFTRPVTAVTRKAEALAKGHFPDSFDKGFCTELDRLSDTLTYASRELRKVERLRQDLIANVSHDLKTPLTMIKAYAEMIRDISGENKAKREAHLGVIASEAGRLEMLVNDILALSRMQSGNASVELKELDVSAAVERVIARFEPMLSGEGCTLSSEVEPALIAQADGRRIEQVLYNLIGNAMNHVGDDKTVLVRVKGLADAVRVEVSDHGAGIAEEDLPRIRERYYKARDHVRGKAGTGLGLAIVREILELHGAGYGVTSRLGEGSTFWFELLR